MLTQVQSSWPRKGNSLRKNKNVFFIKIGSPVFTARRSYASYRGWVSQPTSIYPVCVCWFVCVCMHCCLSRCVPGSLCAWTAEALHLCLDVLHQVYCACVSPLCECVRIDRHAHVAYFNWNVVEKRALSSQFEVIKSCVRTSGRIVWLSWADWVRETSGRDHFRSRQLEWAAV